MLVLAEPSATPAPAPAAHLPSSPVDLPSDVTGPIFTLFSWLLWGGITVCVVAVMVCGATLVNQRKSTGKQVIEDTTLVRILVAAIILGSAASIAQAIL